MEDCLFHPDYENLRDTVRVILLEPVPWADLDSFCPCVLSKVMMFWRNFVIALKGNISI